MERLLAILAKGQFDFAEDEGDEQIGLHFTIPNPMPGDGVERFTIPVDLDCLKALELKLPDGSPVDFTEIYAEYGRDSDGNETEEEDEGDEAEGEETA